MMFKYLMATVVGCSFISVPTISSAQTTSQKLVAYCETPPYQLGGGGENCHSDWHEIVAPDGFVFAKEAKTGGVTSTNPGEHGECTIEWGDMREVVPGVMQPGLVRMKAYGESNRGQGVGGHTRCEITIPLVKLPN